MGEHSNIGQDPFDGLGAKGGDLMDGWHGAIGHQASW